MDTSQKAITVGLTFTWLIAFAGLVLAIRSSLAPLHSSVWLSVVWIIAEILLAIVILVNLVWLDKEAFEEDFGGGVAGMLLVIGIIAYVVTAINLPISREFATWSIVNFVLLSVAVIIDIAVYRDRN